MQDVRFCTSFDHRYLDRGLVLYESLQKHLPGAVLHILALSDECEEFLAQLSLSGIVVVPLSKIFSAEPGLLDARSTRSQTELIFTLTPYIVLETLKAAKPGEHVVYLDADMMFFSSPAEFLRTSDAFEVSITPHNFSPHMRDQARFGIFNVGWVGFRKTPGGERCAKWWADQCLEWCHDRLENGKFADQKYLESFEKITDSVQTSNPVGLNCAPWNASGQRFRRNGQTTLVDKQPLILFHFAKVKRITSWCIATRAKLQGIVATRGLNEFVYRPYAEALEAVTSRHAIPTDWTFGRTNSRHGVKYRGFERDEDPGKLSISARILRGEYVTARSADVFKVLTHRPKLRDAEIDSEGRTEKAPAQPKPPSISMVTPSFNQVEWLASALSSISEQKYCALQHIVMDGGSTDGSLKIIEEHSKDLHTYCSGTDRGQYEAINQGFMLTDGEIMGWLNSDDLHYPWTLSLVSEIFGTFPRIRWLTTCYPIVVDSLARPRDCRAAIGYSRHGILRGETLPGSEGFILGGIQQESTFWRRELWEQVGGRLETEFDYAADFDLWLRFAKYADIYSVSVPLAAFRRHGNQKTSHDMDRYRSQAMLSFKRHGQGFSNRRLRTFARNLLPERLRPLAAKFGWVYPAKILRKHKNTGEWVIHEIFA